MLRAIGKQADAEGSSAFVVGGFVAMAILSMFLPMMQVITSLSSM